MGLTVTSTAMGEETLLKEVAPGIYEGEATAPEGEVKTTASEQVYPVSATAIDEAGNQTTSRAGSITVYSSFDFTPILANAMGFELGYTNGDLDVDVGGDDTFLLEIQSGEYAPDMHGYHNRLFIPGTEYGGLIEDMEVDTSQETVSLMGHTWRGLLRQKIVAPPFGEAYLIISGELNAALKDLLSNRMGDLYVVDDVDTGVDVGDWRVDRYVDLYAAMAKMCRAKGHRLHIYYQQGERTEGGKVHLRAVPIKDYSQELEYSQDARVDFSIRDNRSCINHLVCGGSGEGVDRIVVDLYLQEDGSVGRSPYYTGLHERAAFYDYPNAESEDELAEEGTKRLKELANYKAVRVSVEDIDLEIGDIVGGREQVTGIYAARPVARKILIIKDGIPSVEYRLEGE